MPANKAPFKGKKPGRNLVVMDEFWKGNANPVIAESLARFKKVMEGQDDLSTGSVAFLASVEAQTKKTE